jgi:serine/threonine-protein kinase
MDPTLTQPPAPASGDLIAGKFRLERVIGRGGMGSVWAARHAQLQMPVALKFIEAEEADADVADARVRFEREARAAGQIRSPHVVQIIDHGIDGDRPYIVMELLEGEDLGERLRRERRISVQAASRILSQAAKALRRAHEAGIIHRDLKPGNVFLARFDDDEVVKILDFGVAKMRRSGALDEQQATQVGIVFGSPSYMSPEQARGVRTVDHRSDLWSLAVIIFRAVTGVKPFHADTIADLVIKLCIDPLPVATRIAPDLPPEIDFFFERAFARDLDQRFASAQEMAAAFEVVANVEAAEQAPTGRLPDVSKTMPLVDPPRSAYLPFTATPNVSSTQPLVDSAAGASPFAFAPARPEMPRPPQGAFVAASVAMGGYPEAPAPSVTPPPAPAVDATPSSGSSSVPSGGWRIAPQGAPPPSVRRPPLELASLRPAPTRQQWREPLVLVAILGGALLIAIVLALVARPAAQSPASRGDGESVASAGTVAPSPPEALKPPPQTIMPEPPPPPATSSAPKLEASAAPSTAPHIGSDGGALPSNKRGGKKKPNFGY